MSIYSVTAAHITLVRNGATSVRVLDENTQKQVGFAERRNGFIHFTGTKYSCAEGLSAVVRSTDSTYSALEQALKDGLKNGRDDRN
jgi:hypothetical protein